MKKHQYQRDPGNKTRISELRQIEREKLNKNSKNPSRDTRLNPSKRSKGTLLHAFVKIERPNHKPRTSLCKFMTNRSLSGL